MAGPIPCNGSSTFSSPLLFSIDINVPYELPTCTSQLLVRCKTQSIVLITRGAQGFASTYLERC